MLLGVHTFTPVYLGDARRWQCGVLYAGAHRLAAHMLAGLRAEPGLVVGENEPYSIAPDRDYTVPVQGDGRGVPTVLIEIRQDLLKTAEAIETWAQRLARIMVTAPS